MQHRQPQHQQVPDLPERARPAARHEGETDLRHTAVEHQLDQQVAEDQDDQHDAGQAHEQPGGHLEVAAGGPRGLLGALARGLDEGGRVVDVVEGRALDGADTRDVSGLLSG